MSTVVTNAGSETTNNRAFSSMSSDTLRRAVNGSSSVASNDNIAGGSKKKQPLAQSKQINQVAPPSSLANKAAKPSSSSSSEPITIVEHRKRPCGDGYTVHKYLRGKLLGKGGFAKVYKVTSLDTNKEYAVKIVPKANLVKTRARQKVRVVD